MIRYSEVIAGEAHRMRIARESRGYDAALALAGEGVRVVGRGPVHPLVRAR